MTTITFPQLARFFVIAAPLCLLLIACVPISPAPQPAGPDAEATAPPAPEGNGPALEGVTWQLVEYRGQGNTLTPPAAPATLEFREGRSGGNSGCNNFAAQYTVDGQQLTIKQGAGTMMACAEPSMAQERFFFANLAKITSYEITEAQLHLLDADGQTLLSFIPMTEPVAVGQAGSVLTGTVTYRQRIALPAGSVIVVQLQDVSRADAPAQTIATQTITTTGENVPIPFSLTYEPAQIDARLTYALRVRITSNGELRWINTEQVAVLTNGTPTGGITVVVQPARAAAEAPQATTLVLPDGATCAWAGEGATLAFDGKRVNYTCAESEQTLIALLGDPMPGQSGIWSVEKVTLNHGSDGFTLASSETVTFLAATLDLADGAQCAFAGMGATLAFDGKRLNYTCGEPGTEMVGIIGDLVMGDAGVIMAEKAVIDRSGGAATVKERSQVAVRQINGVSQP